MDSPPIRYARTEDGVRIAYTEVGQGPTLIHLAPSSWGHAAGEWEMPELRYWYERLSGSFRFVRYDHRGFGSSDRAPVLTSLDDRLLDLVAVVDALGVDRVVLLGWQLGSSSAIRYAARHPERVSHLILLNGSAREQDFVETVTLTAGTRRGWSYMTPGTRQLMHDDWDAYSTLVGISAWGWERAESARRWAALNFEAASAAAIEGHIACVAGFDVSDELPLVAAKTLIAQQGGAVTPEGTSLIAGGIPDTTVIAWDRRHWQPWWDEETADAAFAIVSDFALANAVPAQTGAERALQTILFTDLEASTPLTQRLGDEGAQELLHRHNETVRSALRDHGGRQVKHTGDGIMASFPSAVAAVTAALQIQRELAGGEVRVRVGLNAGEPIAEDDDLFGTSVILAARVTDRAEPGQVLVTRVVADLCAGKQLKFRSIGDVTLKGFDGAVELFEVSGQ